MPTDATPGPAADTGEDVPRGSVVRVPRARPARRRNRTGLVLLLLLLTGVIAFLIMTFQPFADMAGGCGGG